MSVQMAEVMAEATKFLQERAHFLILVHVQPDGDAIGSGLGCAHLLKQLGKSFTLVNDDPIPDKFRFLPMADQFLTPEQVKGSFSSVIALDCADSKRMGESATLFASDAMLLNIDHHGTNDRFGQINLIDLSAAATAQIVYNLTKHMHSEMSIEMCRCLYTGLLTDTGGFRYSSTTVEVHQMAADLIGKGVQPYDIADRVLETMTWKQVQLTREALAEIEIDETGRIAWISVPRELLDQIGADDEDVEGLVHYARNVEGVEVGMIFKEREHGQVKVSFRSKHVVDVGQIAKSFGGGGHARASGCTMEGPLSEVRSRVLEKVREAMSQ